VRRRRPVWRAVGRAKRGRLGPIHPSRADGPAVRARPRVPPPPPRHTGPSGRPAPAAAQPWPAPLGGSPPPLRQAAAAAAAARATARRSSRAVASGRILPPRPRRRRRRRGVPLQGPFEATGCETTLGGGLWGAPSPPSTLDYCKFFMNQVFIFCGWSFGHCWNAVSRCTIFPRPRLCRKPQASFVFHDSDDSKHNHVLSEEFSLAWMECAQSTLPRRGIPRHPASH
jgi:hypothetical protein